MSVGNLVELRGQIDQPLAQRRKDLEQQLSRISGYITKSSGDDARQSSIKGIKVKPKHRGPKGETWAGRGMRPIWLAALIKQGHKFGRVRHRRQPSGGTQEGGDQEIRQEEAQGQEVRLSQLGGGQAFFRYSFRLGTLAPFSDNAVFDAGDEFADRLSQSS
jgi:DNA-binding protein H-NS